MSDGSEVNDAYRHELPGSMNRAIAEKAQTLEAMEHFSDASQTLHLAVSMGATLLANGAEINRVEDSMHRILVAYGAIDPEVFAIPSMIITTVRQPDGQPISQLKRIPTRSTNLARVAKLNGLSRRLVAEKLPYTEAMDELTKIVDSPVYPWWMDALGYFLIAASFTMFFGGIPMDGLASGLCGLVVWVITYISGKNHFHPFFSRILAAAVSAFGATLFNHYLPWLDLDLIVIGIFMPMVPGVLMTNGMRDILAGDLVAGLVTLTEAGMVALSIAIGSGFALAMYRFLFITL